MLEDFKEKNSCPLFNFNLFIILHFIVHWFKYIPEAYANLKNFELFNAK